MTIPQMTMCKASIIISIYNHIDWLEMVLIALAQQSERSFEVVLADDGSNQDSVDRIHEFQRTFDFPILHAWQEDLGWRKCRALNLAVRASNADYLIFLDGDCIPDRHFVADHLSLRQKGVVVGGRRAQLPQSLSARLKPEMLRKRWLSSFVLSTLLSRQRHSEDAIRIGSKTLRKLFLSPKHKNLLGCNFSLFKSDLLLVNGFDERYLCPATGEDTDLEARLSRIGIRVLRYRFICRVFHRYHPSAGSDGAGDGNGAVFHYNEKNNISFTPWGIIQNK